MKRSCDMRANFDQPVSVLVDAAIQTGLKIVPTQPQHPGRVQIVKGNGSTCSTIACCLSTMHLIATLAACGKDCLISCKSVG